MLRTKLCDEPFAAARTRISRKQDIVLLSNMYLEGGLKLCRAAFNGFA